MYNFNTLPDRRGTQSMKWDSFAKDLLPMWVADMDFPAPPAVLKALRDRVEHGVFGYGISNDLPEIICSWMLDEFNVSAEKDWIVLLPAVIPAFKAASLLADGPVMMNTPVYNNLLHAPEKAGKFTRLSALKNSGEKYEFDFADMQKRVAPGVKIFFLCNPHNPVGRVFTKDELLELSAFARKNRLLVISDEVHCGLTFDRPHIPWFSVDEYAMEHCITIIGAAKTYNLPGLPFGFAVIPNEKLRYKFRKACFALPEPGVFSVIAARAAFTECSGWKNALVEYLRENRDYLESRLRKTFPSAKLPHVEGTYLQWIDFRPLGMENPWQWLQDHAKILASDGKIYGTEGYVRLNFGTSRSRLEEALDRIEECVKKLNPQ